MSIGIAIVQLLFRLPNILGFNEEYYSVAKQNLSFHQVPMNWLINSPKFELLM